jgi:hypothetical protein
MGDESCNLQEMGSIIHKLKSNRGEKNMKILGVLMICLLVMGGVFALNVTAYNNWYSNILRTQEEARIAQELNKLITNTTISGNLVVKGNLIVEGCIVYDGGVLGKCK